MPLWVNLYITRLIATLKNDQGWLSLVTCNDQVKIRIVNIYDHKISPLGGDDTIQHNFTVWRSTIGVLQLPG